jgi:UDP-2,4-diacetamido-2,4,6-trideoxy-beta-L-altropyranose hydrolase
MGRPGSLTAARHAPDIALRTVEDGDSALLLGWRNESAAVRFSASGRPVTMAEHERWFARVRGDTGTTIWIIEDNGTPVGQVRVDVEDGVGVVSIAIAVEHRGRGIGPNALRAMVDAVTAQGGVQLLRALAHPDNSRSLRAFEVAGFHPTAVAENGFVVMELPVGA